MESVCKLLEERGHTVTRSKDILPIGSPDPMVAKAAQDRNAILVSLDQDFVGLASPNRAGKRFSRLSRINLKPKRNDPVKRLAAALSLIEFENELAQARPEKRFIIDIHATVIKTIR